MSLFESGRLCVKTAGREAGKLCIVLDEADNNDVLITGPKILTGVKKRKCNIEHLEPLQSKIKIKSDARDEEIMDLLKKETEILEKFRLKIPSAEEIKKWESQRSEKEKSKEERQKTEPKKDQPVTISDLAKEKAKIEEVKKEPKEPTLSDLAAENKKLEAQKPKKDAKKKEEKK